MNEDTELATSRARTWPLLAAPVAAAALVLAVLLAGGPDERTAGESPPAAFEEPEPIASVRSEDGRFQLDLMRLETSPADGDARRAKLGFRVRLVRDDPDLFLAHGDPVSKVVTPDGVDRTPKSHSYYDFPSLGRFGARELDLGPAPDRLKLLELSVDLLRLRPEPVEIVVPARDRRFRVLPPFLLFFTPEPEAFSIAIAMTDESLRDYPDGLPDYPSRAFYDSIVVTDAEGAELKSYGGMGTGGGVVRIYHRPLMPEGLLPMETVPIAYPVTVRIRDPRPLETIPAVFRFTDLELPPLAPGPFSDWGEWSKGLRIRVRRPLSIEQGERLPVAAEIDHDPARLPDEAERLVTIEWPAFLALRITPADGGEELLLRPDLVRGPPSPGPDDAPDRLDPLDGTPVPILPVEFPLARLREELAPGDYTARVEYTFPGPEDRWPFFGEQKAAGCWRGTVASAPFAFEIRPETEHRQVYVLPKELVLGPGEHGPVVRFPDENDLLEEIIASREFRVRATAEELEALRKKGR